MVAITDPIADMLTRIRNASLARHQQLTFPASKMKARIAEILQAEGFIQDFSLEGEGYRQTLTLTLSYPQRGENAIHGIKRVSRPGRRVYTNFRNLPRVRNGLGIAILSTSQGVMSDRTASEKQIGGELLCYVW